MGILLFHSLMTFIDLTALSSVVGTILCIYWTICSACIGDEASGNACFDLCRRLFFICLVGLSLSSIGMLVQRTMEMAGVGIVDSVQFLSVVLFQSHYGTMWLLRVASIILAWGLCIFGRRHIDSGFVISLLLVACAAIAFSRSASSHASDYGDLSLQQIADWVHLMAASAWAGSLIAMALILSPSAVSASAEQQHTVAVMAEKFYALFGPVFAMLVASGLYSAWVEVRSLEALLTTTYGWFLSAKLLLLVCLAIRYIAPPIRGKDDAIYTVRFLKRTRIEASLMLAILLCVSLLTHEIPARHALHVMPDHERKMDSNHEMQEGGMSHHMEHGHGM